MHLQRTETRETCIRDLSISYHSEDQYENEMQLLLFCLLLEKCDRQMHKRYFYFHLRTHFDLLITLYAFAGRHVISYIS